MFDDDLTNEEIVEILKKGDPPGLKGFGTDWRKEMDMHPLFMDDIPQEVIDGNLDRTEWPLLASHLDMMYEDDDDPEGCADSYRTDGNDLFKQHNKASYYKAIISYTEGISKKCSNQVLNAQLYCNRAAAQFNIGNYRKATLDSDAALHLDPNYIKAAMRGARSQQKLGNTKAVIDWCDRGLHIDRTNKDFIELKVKSLKKLKEEDRDTRRMATQELKEKRKNKLLLDALRERKHNLYIPDVECEEEGEELLIETLKCSVHGHVYINENNNLVWPVRFLYPQYATSDVISKFCELDCIADHLAVMFPPAGDTPEWDSEEVYVVDNLVVYLNNDNTKIEIRKTDSLLKVLTDNNILISGGVPTFEIGIKSTRT